MKYWDRTYEKWDKQQEKCKDNMIELYGILFGQCTVAMQSEIKSQIDYEEKSAKSDAFWLLTTVKKACSGLSTKKNEA